MLIKRLIGADQAADSTSQLAVRHISHKGVSILSSIVAVSVCIPTNSARVFLFFHILSKIKDRNGMDLTEAEDAFPPRVAFEEGSGPRVLLKSGPGNWSLSASGTTHKATYQISP